MIHPKITSKKKIRKNLPTGLPTLSSWRQRPTLKISLAVATLVMVLAMVNMNINKYEQHLAEGDTVLLALAPVDPRSLMQGDYMRLRFAIADDIQQVLEKQNKDIYQPSEGWVVVRKDEHHVGQFVRLVDNPNTNLAPNEMAIYYRMRGGQVKFATGAFFFQEGHADKYEDSEYGVLKVNDKGEPLLAGLAGSDFTTITAQSDDIGDIEKQ